MKISVSLLSSYLYCSRKLFLEEVLRLKEIPKESLALGSVRHKTYDSINKNEESLVTSIKKRAELKEIERLYRQKYLEALRNAVIGSKKILEQANISSLEVYKKSVSFILEESLTRASNIFNFIESNNVFGDELWQRLTPKIISELRIESDELKLKGIIDQVHVYDDGYIPFELKTGSMPKEGVWPSHRIQIAAYSLLLQEKFRKDVKEGFILYLDSKEKRRIAINPFMKEEVRQLIDEVLSLLESKKLPDFCNNENKCKKCGLRQKCYSEQEMRNLMETKIPDMQKIPTENFLYLK